MNFKNFGKAKIILAVIAVVIVIAIPVSIATSKSNKNNVQNTASYTDSTTQVKTESTTAETTTEEKRLSDDCTYILAAGYDGDNYYELVANQIDGYPNSTFEVGVIKNNNWLVDMSTSSPFLDDEGWWKDLNKSYEKNMPKLEHFKYIKKGCFLFNDKIFYRPENNIVFDKLCNRDYSTLSNVDEFMGYTEWHAENSGSCGFTFKYFNSVTGKSKEIKGFFADGNIRAPQKVYDISDNLFLAFGETLTYKNWDYVKYSGVFDLEGNMIIDLSKYDITDYHGYVFKNGKYTITCENKSNVEYDITFDTTGKVISQEKVS